MKSRCPVSPRFTSHALLLCAGLVLSACPATSGDTGDGAPVPDGGARPDGGSCGAKKAPNSPNSSDPPQCSVTLRTVLPAKAAAVYVAGEWNQFSKTAQPLTGPDPNGAYQATLKLPPGTYGYKIIADDNWTLDPSNGYRRYVKGTENSGLRVPDCRLPAVRVAKDGLRSARPGPGQGNFSVTVDIALGQAGGALCGVTGTLRRPEDHAGAGYSPKTLSAAELKVAQDGKTAEVILTGLPDGKYTLSLQPNSGDGTGEPLLLPFWIEQRPFHITDTPLYMAVTDRFRDGDPTNNPAPIPGVFPATDYKGGDLLGVQKAIKDGYFDGMGIKALWITPWQTQPAEGYIDATGMYHVSGYHGYWPTRAREVDPRLGGAEALHNLIEEAHRHGIRVVMDAVLNHVHEKHEYFTDAKRRDWFRTGCICGTDNCDWTTHRLDCLFASYLPDINWTVADASEQFISDILWWVETFDLDGLRIDAVKHVEDLATFNLAARVRERFENGGTQVYMVGETAMGWSDTSIAGNADNYDTIKRYMGPLGLSGQFDFVLYHAVPYRSFARDEAANRRFLHVDYWTHASLDQFAGSDMGRYIGGHDTTRFITTATYRGQSDTWAQSLADRKWAPDVPMAPPDQEPYDRLWLGMLNLLTLPGVPLLYYGDEYGEYGGGDPDNRHMMRFAGLSDRESAQQKRMTTLLSARAKLLGISRGDMKTTTLLQEDLYAYARPGQDPKESALVVLNRLPTPQEALVPVPAEVGWPTGARVVDYLTGTEYSVAAGTVMATVPARGGLLLGMK